MSGTKVKTNALSQRHVLLMSNKPGLTTNGHFSTRAVATAAAPAAAAVNGLVNKMKVDGPGLGPFSAVFDHRGGRLGTYWSDDYLEIPPNAISEGERWRVTGFIHTSVDQYSSYINRDEGERLVAPVIQYHVDSGEHFKKLVKIVIHHSITCDCKSLEDKVSVVLKSYTPNSNDELVPHAKLRSKDGPYFEVDSAHITVYTYHFCDIICKLCDKEHVEDVELKGMLYGRLNQDVNENFVATLEFYVVVQSALNKKSVFTETFHDDRKVEGKIPLGCQSFPLSLKQIDSDDTIVLTTHILTPEWQLSPFELLEFPACDYIPCLKHPTDPKLVGLLTLRGKSLILNGILLVSIEKCGGQGMRSPLKVSYSLSAPASTPNVSLAGLTVSSEQWKITDRKLRDIAQKIKITNWHDVGINLGLSDYELGVIASNMCLEHPQTTIFKMLQAWRDRKNARLSEANLKKELHEALKRTVPEQTKAIEELNSDENQVLRTTEASDLAFATLATDEDNTESSEPAVELRPASNN